jgi:hypothetical protein
MPLIPERTVTIRKTSALEWLRNNEGVRATAVRGLRLRSPSELPQVLLREPGRMVDLATSVLDQAIASGADTDVVAGFKSLVKAMTAGSRKLKTLAYARGALASLQNATSVENLAEGLAKAMASAPDDANRNKLRGMIKQVGKKQPLVSPEDLLKPLKLKKPGSLSADDDCDKMCCGFLCFMCGFGGGGPLGCLFCCFVACLTCA